MSNVKKEMTVGVRCGFEIEELKDVNADNDAYHNFDLIFSGEKSKAQKTVHDLKYVCFRKLGYAPKEAYSKTLSPLDE